jgi:phospholipid-binding lipoprotein MlaA
MNHDTINYKSKLMITQKNTIKKHLLLTSVALSIALGGCSSVPNDPFHGWNQGTQSFNDGLDRHVVKPVAIGYEAITPDPVSESITNFFSNMNDIGVTVNDVLQLKLLQGGMDLSRFIINSTVGVAGFFDVATLIDLPKHHEDFGQTLGFWGVPSGPYLVLPFFGPSSPRDTVGLIGDAALNPLTYVSIFGGAAGSIASGSASAVRIADTRAGLMATEKVVNEGAVDRYDFLKNAYQQHREYLIHDGNPPSNDVEFDDIPDADNTGGKIAPAPSKPSNTAPKGNSSSNTGAGMTNAFNNKGLSSSETAATNSDANKHQLTLSAPEHERASRASDKDMRPCLNLSSNEAIAKCTARAK